MFFSQNLINQKQKIINHFSFTNLINKIYMQIKEVTKGSNLSKLLCRFIHDVIRQDFVYILYAYWILFGCWRHRNKYNGMPEFYSTM